MSISNTGIKRRPTHPGEMLREDFMPDSDSCFLPCRVKNKALDTALSIGANRSALDKAEHGLDYICSRAHTSFMQWEVRFADEFEPEFDELPEAVQDELLAKARLLETFGPDLGRPHVDTLNDSRHANMKELRFTANDGVWRVAFAFDPDRNAILLVAADKAGVKQRRFYRRLLALADKRFDNHLTRTIRE